MNWEDLVQRARAARQQAWAPYSRFSVGAALLMETGEVFVGCNVENISFGLTLCAERVAVGAAVTAGKTKPVAIAVVADSAEPVVPCGACRQVLAEFNPQLTVVTANLQGNRRDYVLSELLPVPKQGILG